MLSSGQNEKQLIITDKKNIHLVWSLIIDNTSTYLDMQRQCVTIEVHEVFKVNFYSIISCDKKLVVNPRLLIVNLGSLVV